MKPLYKGTSATGRTEILKRDSEVYEVVGRVDDDLANLIAAAPEMLEALEHTLTMIRSGDLDKAGYVQTVESVVSAAINKAKG